MKFKNELIKLKKCCLYLSLIAFLLPLTVCWSKDSASSPIELTMLYSYEYLYKHTLVNEIAPAFMKANPGIRVRFEPGAKSYEAASEYILEKGKSRSMPDLSLQGYSRQKTLIEKGLAVALNKFISSDEKWQSHGLNPKALSLTTFDEKVYALPFTLSTPIIIYNADLVRRAGGDPDNLPKSWNGILKLAGKINELENEIHGLNYVWNLTGNWMFQALIFSKGGEMMFSDGKTLGFTGPAGQFAVRLIDRMVKETQMPNLTEMQSIKMMARGQLGILAFSCGDLDYVQKISDGKVEFRVAPFPEVVTQKGRLPVGGTAVMMHTKDPKIQQAAWKFIKFLTGPQAQTMQVHNMSYMPVNTVAMQSQVLLGNYFARHPERRVAADQISLIREWYAFPNPNGLKISKVIEHHLERIVRQTASPEQALEDMATEVKTLLPSSE